MDTGVLDGHVLRSLLMVGQQLQTPSATGVGVVLLATALPAT
ncbi:hypothetical protein [Streptomyces regalis]|nr:hypothetical protein [Streptomyces regalis]